MRRNIAALSIGLASLTPGLVAAQQAAQPPAPTVPGNMAVVSDYRFRGISQTFRGPAIQGGLDYSHDSGFYVGNWNSSVSTLSYANGSGIEMDFYGGWKKEIAKDSTIDLGLLQYYYPNARISSGGTTTKYDTLELYGAFTFKNYTIKYSHTLSDYFGVNSQTLGGVCNRNGADCFAAKPGDSKGSGYLDLSASFELMPKVALAAHVGMQKVKNYSKLDYVDYKLGVTYDVQGWLLGAALIGTNADEKWYYVTDGSGRTKETGKNAIILSVSKTF